MPSPSHRISLERGRREDGEDGLVTMSANHPEPGPREPGPPGPPDPVVLLRSRSYLMLLALAAILGVPISAATCCCNEWVNESSMRWPARK
jgi:hypothetical protein